MDNKFDPKKSANNSVKSMMFSMAVYSSSSILGPLIFFGGLGWLADHFLGTKHFGLILGVFIAFVITNFLILSKAIALTKKFSSENKNHPEHKPNGYDEDNDDWPKK